ncbi:MAG: UDP-N-acetylmuramate dehydrogenase [Moraxella sp.]|nr:UDP-N-acetylmuramate dehydrogenase [Moraxella sp.]
MTIQRENAQLLQNYSLSHLNTMALSCTATQAVILTQEQQVGMASFSHLPLFILSGGSNVLLPERLEARVLLPRFAGIHIAEETEDCVVLDVMGGENWHNLVKHCTEKGWYGLENLALIPGLVGAAPVQNIGAYGVQLEDVLLGVKVFDFKLKRWEYIKKEDCGFEYRNSRFKHEPHKLITCLRIRLHKDSSRVNIDYGDLKTLAPTIAAQDERTQPTATDVFHAVIKIRQEKLPDPQVLSNCGSFFQNPIISSEQYQELKERFHDIPHYPIDGRTVKVPAGWLIDRAGLKGGGVAPILTHKNQALVLTNHAPHIATQRNIKTSQDFISKIIAEHFGIFLIREPVWVSPNGSTSAL